MLRYYGIYNIYYVTVQKPPEQEMFVKHVCLPKLKCHCDLDLETPNSIGVIY